MPVNTTGSTVQYTGDAEQTTFPFTFPIGSEGDLVVKVRVTATGVTVTQTLTTHYTVTKSGTNFDNGGNVEMVSAPAATDTLIIARDTTQTQSTDLLYGDPHDSEAYEDMVDRNTLMIQELQAQVDRCLKIPDTDADGLGVEFVNSIDRASQYAGFDTDGKAIAAATFAAYGAASAYIQTLLDDADATTALATLGLTVSAYIKTVLDDADAAAAKVTLEVMDAVPATRYLAPSLVGWVTDAANIECRGTHIIFGAAGYAYLPVHLPNGAIVTELYSYAEIADNDIEITLSRCLFTNQIRNVMAINTHVTTGAATDGTISNATIDNDNYTYFVRCFRNIHAADSDVNGVKITYTITDPMP